MRPTASSRRRGGRDGSIASTTAISLIVFFAGVLVPAAADADPIKCKSRIARESAHYVQTRMKALAGCHEFVVKHAQPGPCPDARAAATIAKAESKMRTRIATNCGGLNRICGDVDDQPLAAIGWTAPTCPDFRGAGCTNAITDCGGIVDCLICAAAAAVDGTVALSYDDLEPSAPMTTLNSCQVRLGKETLRFVRSTSKALQGCWDLVNKGDIAGPCPVPGDGRAQPAIDHASTTVASRICAVCGGADRSCDGTVDIAPADIGFSASCPSVSPPSGGSCGAPIGSLTDLVQCSACVARHAVDCIDALAVPWAGAYPPACN